MIAVLLSAGKGTRLYPLTQNTPKCLIDLGGGKTILEKQLDTLIDCDFKSILIVAGYKIDQIQAKVDGYKNPNNVCINIIQNPFYETSNNIISLWLSLFIVTTPFISINGDNIFNKKLLGKLVEKEGDIVMTVNPKDKFDFDDMLVYARDDHAINVGKDLDPKVADFESVGIIKYSMIGLSVVKNELNQMLQTQSNHNVFYLKMLDNLMKKGFPVKLCYVDETDWAEIDFHPDVESIRNNILIKNKP